ncbi:MAG: HAMP domain-containing protein [Calditrichaeota bacterium]|nr:MAG: HAMP domain-containing protein [Calditrichota bacterium]
MNSIRNKLIILFLCITILPLIPLAWIVNQLVHYSYQIGVNPSVEEALKSGIDFSLNVYQQKKQHLQETLQTIIASEAITEQIESPETTLTLPVTLLPRDDGEWRYKGIFIFNRNLKKKGAVIRGGVAPPEISSEQLQKFFSQGIEEVVIANRAQNLFYAIRKLPENLGVAVLVASLDPSFLKKSDHLLQMYKLYRSLHLTEVSIPRQFLYTFLALSLFILMATVMVATWFSRKITGPLKELVEGTRELGRGNLDFRVQLQSQDEIGDLAEHFNQMAKALKDYQERTIYLERMAAWREIARRLAHEIKNPLTPIQLTVQEMVDQYPGDDPEYQKLLQECHGIISEELENLRKLVHEFSEFGRLPELQLSPRQLHHLITEVVRLYPHQTIECHFDPEVGEIEVDEDRFRRIIINLLENAIQANEKQLPITITTHKEEEEVIIKVTDQGKGIPEEHLSRIFQPYFTTRSGGAGLGLAITRRMVEEHGGTISVQSEVGKGTTFTIKLPVKKIGKGGTVK